MSNQHRIYRIVETENGYSIFLHPMYAYVRTRIEEVIEIYKCEPMDDLTKLHLQNAIDSLLDTVVPIRKNTYMMKEHGTHNPKEPVRLPDTGDAERVRQGDNRGRVKEWTAWILARFSKGQDSGEAKSD